MHTTYNSDTHLIIENRFCVGSPKSERKTQKLLFIFKKIEHFKKRQTCLQTMMMELMVEYY